MARDYLIDLDEIRARVNEYADANIEVAETLKYCYRQKAIIEEELNRVNRKLHEYEDSAGMETESDIYAKASEILEDEIRKALDKNPEFDLPGYKERLIQAANTRDVIYIEDWGNGDCLVQINMNQVAGTTDDYIKAVNATREALKISIFNPKKVVPPAMRSHMWAEKLYGSAREGKTVSRKRRSKISGKEETVDLTDSYKAQYFATMNMRLDSMSSLAPFWEILDKGNFKWNEDTGGDAYPKSGPTNFVSNTETRIRALFRTYYRLNMNNRDDNYYLLLHWSNEAYDLLRFIDEKIKELEEGGERKKVAARLVQKQLGERMAKADVDAVEALIETLTFGEALPARIRLGGGQRVRTISLQKQFIKGIGIGK